jgi:hypothetical protein
MALKEGVDVIEREAQLVTDANAAELACPDRSIVSVDSLRHPARVSRSKSC